MQEVQEYDILGVNGMMGIDYWSQHFAVTILIGLAVCWIFSLAVDAIVDHQIEKEEEERGKKKTERGYFTVDRRHGGRKKRKKL
ncbi:MAG: hypothetical protein MJZ20_01685 [Bacteroidaceae bacterium]|nr:hypothetical protein [Bacteroidaceae bacterium]